MELCTCLRCRPCPYHCYHCNMKSRPPPFNSAHPAHWLSLLVYSSCSCSTKNSHLTWRHNFVSARNAKGAECESPLGSIIRADGCVILPKRTDLQRSAQGAVPVRIAALQKSSTSRTSVNFIPPQDPCLVQGFVWMPVRVQGFMWNDSSTVVLCFFSFQLVVWCFCIVFLCAFELQWHSFVYFVQCLHVDTSTLHTSFLHLGRKFLACNFWCLVCRSDTSLSGTKCQKTTILHRRLPAKNTMSRPGPATGNSSMQIRLFAQHCVPQKKRTKKKKKKKTGQIFKPRTPPARRLSEAAYLSYHAVVIVAGMDGGGNPPPWVANISEARFGAM